jgi:hypothetical protein
MTSTHMPEPRGSGFARFPFLSETAPNGFALQFGLNMVSRLEKRFWHSLHQYGGMGETGVLLGEYIPNEEIVVEDYQAVNQAAAPTGAALLPVVSVISQWKRQPGKRTSYVGLYRFAAAETLGPNADEISAFRHFADQPAILLLLYAVGDGEISAKLFVAAHGVCDVNHPQCLIDFGRERMQSSGPQLPEGHPNGPAQEPVPRNDEPSPATEPRAGTRDTSLSRDPSGKFALRAALVAVSVALVALLAYQGRGSIRFGKDPKIARASSALGMDVSQRGIDLQVTWDASAPVVQTALQASVEIWDGSEGKAITLTADQLKAGRLLYVPRTDDVNILLRLLTADHNSVTDSIRVIHGAGSAIGAALRIDTVLPAGEPVLGDRSVPIRAEWRKTRVTSPPSELPPQREPVEAADSRTVVRGPEMFRPPAARLQAAPVPPLIEAAALPAAVMDSSLSHVLPALVPAVGELPGRPSIPQPPKNEPQAIDDSKSPAAPSVPRNFSAAVLISKPTMTFPADLRELSRNGVSLDLQVSIDENGRVTDAIPLGKEGLNVLTRVVANTVRTWRFSPAKIDGHPVPSQQVIKCRYKR